MALSACGSALSPSEAGDLLSEQMSTQFVSATFKCTDGQGEWDYICDVRYDPKGLSAQRGLPPTVQRQGARRVGTYQGKAQFMLTVLPSDGSVPTMQELQDQQKAAHEEYDRKSKGEIERAIRR